MLPNQTLVVARICFKFIYSSIFFYFSEFDMEDKKNFGHQSLNSKRFAHSNPELSKSLLATYNGNCPNIKKDLEIQVWKWLMG